MGRTPLRSVPRRTSSAVLNDVNAVAISAVAIIGVNLPNRRWMLIPSRQYVWSVLPHTWPMPSRRSSKRILFGRPHADGRPWYVQGSGLPTSATVAAMWTVLGAGTVIELISLHHPSPLGTTWRIISLALFLSLLVSALTSVRWFLRQRRRGVAADPEQTSLVEPDHWWPHT